LTTKDQGVIFERTTETTTITPKGNSDRSRFIFLEIASYKRCSRPLCSSQTTTPYHTPHTRPTKGNNRVIGAARKPETQVPERKNPPGPVVSGPNSVPNTTQQLIPACVPGHPQESIRTNCRPVPPGTYLLIFHP